MSLQSLFAMVLFSFLAHPIVQAQNNTSAKTLEQALYDSIREKEESMKKFRGVHVNPGTYVQPASAVAKKNQREKLNDEVNLDSSPGFEVEIDDYIPTRNISSIESEENASPKLEKKKSSKKKK